MHVPDGFLDAPTSVATGVVAAGGVAVCAARGPRRARRPHRADGRAGRGVRLRDPDAQLPGRGRHQRAPARRRARRGPRRPVDRRVLCMSVGAARPGPALRRRRHHRPRHQHRPDGPGHASRVGWSSSRRVQAVLPKRLSMVAPSRPAIARAGLGAGRGAGVRRCCSPSAAPPTSRSATLVTAMVGVHVLIGIGEAVITGLAVGSVVAVRPDLVYGARPVLVQRELEIRTAPASRRRRMSRTRTAFVARRPRSSPLLLVAGVGQLLRRRSHPDGLEQGRRATPGFVDQRRPDGDRRLSARRLRDQGRRRRPAQRRPGRRSPASWSCCVARRRAHRVGGATPATDVARRRERRRSRWAPDTATGCTTTATRRCTGCRRT